MKSLSELALTEATAQKYVQENRCAECGGTLHISSGTYYGYDEAVIKCIRSKDHSEFGRPLKKETDNEARINKYRRLSELSQQMGNEQGRAVTVASMGIGTGIVTRDQAREMLLSVYPGAPEIEIKKAEILCTTYNLSPLRKQIFLIPYKNADKRKACGCTCDDWPCPHPQAYDWSIQLGIGASRQIVGSYADFSYVDDTPRLMSEEEERKIYRKVNTSWIRAIVKLYNPRSKTTAVGYGDFPATGAEPKGVGKGNSRERQAMTRAERQALDRLCPGKLPQDVDVVDERTIDLPPSDYKIVDTNTGQIMEAQAKVLDPKPASAQTPTSGAVNGDTPLCPIHNEPMRENKWHGYSHILEGETNPKTGKQAYCNWKSMDELQKAILEAKNKASVDPADKETPEPAEPTPTMPAEENEGQEETPAGNTGQGDAPTRGECEDMAKKLWGDKWEGNYRNFLKDVLAIGSRKDIKETDVPKIASKLVDMIAASGK